MQIYLARDNQQAGPYTLEQLNQMLASQQVLLTDLIWHQGMTEWKTVGEVTQGQYAYQPAGASTPIFNPQPTHQSIQLDKHPQASKSQPQLSSLGKRFLAKIIDLCLWIPASLILTAFLTDAQREKITELQLLAIKHLRLDQVDLAEKASREVFSTIPDSSWMMFFAYLICMLIGQALLLHKTGQSVGKKVMNIQVVDATTLQTVGSTRSFLFRSLVTILLIYIFPLYFIIDYLFGLGKKRQTLHDLIAKTTVIDKK